MSLPYLQPYLGLSNGLNTLHAAGAAGGVGGWVELARTTLGSAGDDIDVNNFADKRYLMILSYRIPSGDIDTEDKVGTSASIDTGSNYAYRRSENGGADGANAPTTSFFVQDLGASKNYNTFNVGYIANYSSKEKLGINHIVTRGSAGAGTAPNRCENVAKWANTSSSLQSYRAHNGRSGNYDTGSEVVVLGYDPLDSHSNNFWEELASVTGTTATTISSGTISAKKYLWIQLYCDAASSGAPILRFNSDSGSNYARRYSNNGGSDSTSTSEDAIYPYYQSNANPKFINMFVINNQSNEKLVISHNVEQNTAGASNSPFRNELVGKWANTSNQITNITFTDISAGNYFGTSAQLKVWGAD